MESDGDTTGTVGEGEGVRVTRKALFTFLNNTGLMGRI